MFDDRAWTLIMDLVITVLICAALFMVCETF